MPNRPRFGNATFRRGLLAANSGFLKWCSQAGTAAVDRHTVTVQLLNESGAVTTTWTLENAWPAKLPVTVDSGNETAVEAIELAFESIAQR
jgi:phage tail-like protein